MVIQCLQYRHFMVEKTKHDVCQNCIKRFYKSLRKNAIEIINFGEKKITLLTKKESQSYSSLSYLQKKFREEHAMMQNIVKLVIIVITQVNRGMLQIANAI